MGPEAVCATNADAFGTRGWGAFLGDLFFQGSRPKGALCEGINWNGLWVLIEALSSWRQQVKRKLPPQSRAQTTVRPVQAS